MPETEVPDVVDESDEETVEEPAETGVDDGETGDDVEVLEIEPEGDELAGGLLDDFEDAESGESGIEAEDGDDQGEDVDEDGDEDEGGVMVETTANEELAGVINDGAARLAVVGLTDEDFEEDKTPSELEEELREVFGAFRLGEYAGASAEKYIMAPGDDEIDPVWGLLCSCLVAGAVTIMLRPDGSEISGGLKEQVDGLLGGAL